MIFWKEVRRINLKVFKIFRFMSTLFRPVSPGVKPHLQEKERKRAAAADREAMRVLWCLEY